MYQKKIDMFQSAAPGLPENTSVGTSIKDTDLFVSLINTGPPSTTTTMPGTNNFLQEGLLGSFESDLLLPKPAFPLKKVPSWLVLQACPGDNSVFPINPIPPESKKPVIDIKLPADPTPPPAEPPIELVQAKPEKPAPPVITPAITLASVVEPPADPTPPPAEPPTEQVQAKPEKPAPPEIQGPVAANEFGRIWSDPMFRGGDGGRFDVSGEVGKAYNLLSDSGLQLNGRFDRFMGDPNGTCVGEVGLTVTGPDGKTSLIGFTKDGRATLDGQPLPMSFFGQKQYALADGGSVQRTFLGGLRVKTAEGYIIDLTSSGAYIDIDARTGQDGVDNGQMPGGLLGHTFDADKIARNGRTGRGAQGEGAIEGVVQDYELPGLFGSNLS